MCGKQWSQIKYKNVPSVAMNRLRKAFERNDPQRFKDYLEAVSQGKQKINAGQLFPHEIVKPYLTRGQNQLDLVLEEQWKAYVKKVIDWGQLDQAVVISDVSGSMSNNNALPLQVSIALGLLIATVKNSSLPPNRQRPLVVALTAACASVGKGQPIRSANQSHSFQNKVLGQVTPFDPALAHNLILVTRNTVDLARTGARLLNPFEEHAPTA